MVLLDKLSFPSRLIVLQTPRRQTAGWQGDWIVSIFGNRLSGRHVAASRSFPIATSCSSFALKRMADCYTIGPDRPLPLPTQKDPLRLGVWIRVVSPCSLFRSGMIASVPVASTDDCRAIHHVLVENCHSSSLRQRIPRFGRPRRRAVSAAPSQRRRGHRTGRSITEACCPPGSPLA
jgi:hypothetical protein